MGLQKQLHITGNSTLCGKCSADISHRPERARLTHSVLPVTDSRTEHNAPAPWRLSMLVACTRYRNSSFPARFPPMALFTRRPPFLGRVPAAPVPRRPQYYAGVTTPRTASLRLIDSPAGTTLCLLLRSRSPAGRGGPGPFVLASGPCSGLRAWTDTGPPRFPGEPSCGYANVL